MKRSLKKTIYSYLQIKIDKKGNYFIAFNIDRNEIKYHIDFSKKYLGFYLWNKLKSKKEKRDGKNYHLTVASPYEYRGFKIKRNFVAKIQLWGLGYVSDGKNLSFYIVASCSYASRLRKMLNLKNKNFHITIGFHEEDIHYLEKDINTLIPTS